MKNALLTRLAGAPLMLAPEHLGRYALKTVEDAAGKTGEEITARARAMTLSASKANACEFILTGYTSGYFKRADGLAVIPIWGDLGPRRAYWPWVWYEDVAEAAETASKDGDVKAILYHIDSPGGYVSGLADCAAAIEAAAKTKPSAAYAQDMAASAAYWIASASGRITAPATAVVGSIGSLCVHEEYARMLEESGITVNVIRSAPRKAEANPFEPLSQAARQELQAEVTACADDFIAAIARLRQLDEGAIRATQAAGLLIEQAVQGGFADGVESFDAAAAALLARAAPPAAIGAPVPAPVAKTQPHPARGKTAKTTPARPRASGKRSSTMDPTQLPPEEQIKRYDEIVALVAEPPADDAGKIGQFQQIIALINAGTEEETEVDPADPAADPNAAPAAKAKVAAAIAASPEAKKNPGLALAAISSGMSLAQFKAAAAAAPASSSLHAKMQAGSLGTEAGGDRAGAESGNVTQLQTSAEIFAARNAASKKA